MMTYCEHYLDSGLRQNDNIWSTRHRDVGSAENAGNHKFPSFRQRPESINPCKDAGMNQNRF